MSKQNSKSASQKYSVTKEQKVREKRSKTTASTFVSNTPHICKSGT